MGFEIYLIPFPFAENHPPYHRLVISKLDTINMQILPVKPSFSMSAKTSEGAFVEMELPL